MAQTLSDLLSLTLSNDFDASVYSTQARQAILDAVGEVSRNVRLPANETTSTITTVAGTAGYTLPTGAVRVLSIIDPATADPLTDVGMSVLDDEPDTRGRPSSYGLYGTSITLSPTPDQAYSLTLRYLRQGATPTSDSDVVATATGIPEDYLFGLVAYARGRLFLLEDDAEMAAVWQGQWQQALAKLKADVQRRDLSTVRRVPSMWTGSPSPRFVRP